MTPDDTFYFRPTDGSVQVADWFEWVLERAREARISKLLRPVFREEYYEVGRSRCLSQHVSSYA